MEINLVTAGKAKDILLINVNGKLACEVAVGMAQTRDDLFEKVTAARKLRALPRIIAGIMSDLARIADMPDHIHTTPQKKREACLRGLVDGFEGKTVPYPGGEGLIPPIPPDSTLSYSRGYQIGEVFARCVKGEDVAALVRDFEVPEDRVA